MQKLKAEKGGGESQERKRKYKLGSKEMALMEMEKKRKLDEKLTQKKDIAKKAGVPDNFFDSAKTKAFLNLGKAPQKSILKNTGAKSATKDLPKANVKAKGSEWTSSGPVLSQEAVAAAQNKKEKSPQKTLLRTPSGGTINHLQEEMEVEVKAATNTGAGDKGDLPEGFFDDPVLDAKARGVEYKVNNLINLTRASVTVFLQDAEEAEWEAFQKEIAVEVAVSAQMTAEEQLEETTDRQLEVNITFYLGKVHSNFIF